MTSSALEYLLLQLWPLSPDTVGASKQPYREGPEVEPCHSFPGMDFTGLQEMLFVDGMANCYSEVHVDPSTVVLSWLHHLRQERTDLSLAAARSNLQLRSLRLDPSASPLFIQQSRHSLKEIFLGTKVEAPSALIMLWVKNRTTLFSSPPFFCL